jgi:hypothetical protein
MTNILASKSAEMQAKREAMLREADRLLCESWNEKMWSDGELIVPSPTIDQRSMELPLAGDPVRSVQDSERRRPRFDEAPPTRFVHDLVSRLRCQKCAKAGRRPEATLLQLACSRGIPARKTDMCWCGRPLIPAV